MFVHRISLNAAGKSGSIFNSSLAMTVLSSFVSTILKLHRVLGGRWRTWTAHDTMMHCESVIWLLFHLDSLKQSVVSSILKSTGFVGPRAVCSQWFGACAQGAIASSQLPRVDQDRSRDDACNV